MKLSEWAEGWPYRLQMHVSGACSVPDSLESRADESYRAKAWRLEDYLVSSVSGGSIWFIPRKEIR